MFGGMQLGRVDAELPAGLPTLDQHPIMQATAPLNLDRSAVDYRPALDLNDQIGDCTCVAVANTIRAQAALAGYQVGISTERVVSLYSAVSGYPAHDQGALEVDVLTYQAVQGFDIGQQTKYYGLWANIPIDNLNLIKLVMARMGVAYLGVNLSVSDRKGQWIGDPPAALGNPKPGSWGGHALLAWSYTSNVDVDDEIWTLATWGKLVKCSGKWLRSRLTEAHALYHPQMLGPLGRNPAGLDRDRLRADIDAFASYA